MYKALIITLALLAGCSNVHDGNTAGAPAPAGTPAAANRPAEGQMVAYPPVPLFPSPESTGAQNLLKNGGFEEGNATWAVDGPAASASSGSNQLVAEGASCLQVVPSEKGEVTLTQNAKVKQRTFYAFRALAFMEGSSKITLQVKDASGNSVITQTPLTGPLTMWSRLSLVFVTGVKADEITAQVICTDVEGNKPILLDQCSLQALPTNNVMPAAPAQAPEAAAAVMPRWYCGGKPALPNARGVNGDTAFEIPLFADRASSLGYFIHLPIEMSGQPVWVSSQIKTVPKDKAAPPEVTMATRLAGADGQPAEKSVTCPAANDWVEAAMSVRMPPPVAPDAPNPPPPALLLFKCPAGAEGQVFVDDVVMLQIPEGRMDGALLPSGPSAP